MIHKIKTKAILDIPRYGAAGDADGWVTYEPQIVSARWERNDHRKGDRLSITIAHRDGGVDPRLIKNARILFYLWDDNQEDFDSTKHLRFAGICDEAERALDGDDRHVTMTFHDYTVLFSETPQYPQQGIPEWSDTLDTAWKKICDHTGWFNVETGQIESSVTALRDRLVLRLSRPVTMIGEMTADRFHKLSKPAFAGAKSSWDVWQSIVGALGLVSYIDKDRCIVTEPHVLYDESKALQFLYGHNVLAWKETASTKAAMSTGVIMYAFNSSTGKMLEAAYPPPGDPRVKMRTQKKRAKGVNLESPEALNQVSTHYERFAAPSGVIDQAVLGYIARATWEERSRQEISGSLRTAETTLFTGDGVSRASIFDLGAGSPIRVGFDDESYETLSAMSDAERMRHLVERAGYTPDVAKLVLQNMASEELKPVFHVTTMRAKVEPNLFEVELEYHNRIRVS